MPNFSEDNKAAIVRFQGFEYMLFLAGGSSIDDWYGSIATQEQWREGKCSYAYLGPDGTIRRYREIIGQRSDLEFVRLIENPQHSEEAIVNMICDPSWDGPPENE